MAISVIKHGSELWFTEDKTPMHLTNKSQKFLIDFLAKRGITSPKQDFGTSKYKANLIRTCQKVVYLHKITQQYGTKILNTSKILHF